MKLNRERTSVMIQVIPLTIKKDRKIASHGELSLAITWRVTNNKNKPGINNINLTPDVNSFDKFLNQHSIYWLVASNVNINISVKGEI